ncbi:MAG: alcohol dehydrogenase catalytic domain-containing protein [Chloroflexi bacterium]|nr:alcohol dehydrogenase catalytic domain-containing protein [Chloroflexota bacterium]
MTGAFDGRTIRALRFFDVNDLRLVDEAVPTPGPGEVRIRPAAVGICGTDAHIVDGSFASRPPVILGHEVAGYVDAVGAGVHTVREGDLVTVEPHRYDGTCRYCRTGREHLCLGKEAYGVHLDGGMAEAQIVPARIAYVLPRGTDPAIGAMTEPLSCCLHAFDRLAPVAGLPVAIFGAGPAGLILVALPRQVGLGPVVVLEPDAARRATAVAFGAAAGVDPMAPDWVEQCHAFVGPEGFDFVIEAVGRPAVLESTFRIASRGARILVFGVARPDETAVIKPQEVFAKELTILGTVINPYTYHRAVELLPGMGLDRLRVKSYPLAEHAQAFAAQHERVADKVQFAPQGS